LARLQLALNVEDLDAAIEFYTRLFRTGPAKVRDGYANFAIDDPPLKLVLVSGYGKPGSLNHLGVEVATSDEVQAAQQRLRDEGLETTVEDETECCYATQDKVWVSDPAGAWWEVYTVLGDSDVFNPEAVDAEPSTSKS
jgi:catechol 2,3-dioxygenase-like lactoylglutathione lyase family enzyme